MKWRVMLELVGPDGIVCVHEVGGRAAVAEYAPRLNGLALEEGKHLLAALHVHQHGAMTAASANECPAANAPVSAGRSFDAESPDLCCKRYTRPGLCRRGALGSPPVSERGLTPTFWTFSGAPEAHEPFRLKDGLLEAGDPADDQALDATHSDSVQ